MGAARVAARKRVIKGICFAAPFPAGLPLFRPGEIEDYGREPGGKVRVAPEGVNLAPCGQEGILDDVTGVLVDAGHPERYVQQHALVPVYQALERRRIPLAAGARKDGVIGGVVVHTRP